MCQGHTESGLPQVCHVAATARLTPLRMPRTPAVPRHVQAFAVGIAPAPPPPRPHSPAGATVLRGARRSARVHTPRGGQPATLWEQPAKADLRSNCWVSQGGFPPHRRIFYRAGSRRDAVESHPTGARASQHANNCCVPDLVPATTTPKLMPGLPPAAAAPVHTWLHTVSRAQGSSASGSCRRLLAPRGLR